MPQHQPSLVHEALNGFVHFQKASCYLEVVDSNLHATKVVDFSEQKMVWAINQTLSEGGAYNL